jgi:hypothetical protein
MGLMVVQDYAEHALAVSRKLWTEFVTPLNKYT